MRRLFAGLLLLLAVVTCAPLQEPPTVYGRTYCLEGEPWIAFTEATWKGAIRELIVAHELVHLEQIHREGGCARWTARLDDPEYVRAIETEAWTRACEAHPQPLCNYITFSRPPPP